MADAVPGTHAHGYADNVWSFYPVSGCPWNKAAAYIFLTLSALSFCLGMTLFLLIALLGTGSASPKVKASPCMAELGIIHACP